MIFLLRSIKDIKIYRVGFFILNQYVMRVFQIVFSLYT